MREALREQFSLAGVPAEHLHDELVRHSLTSAALGNIVVGLVIASAFVVVLLGILGGSDWGHWGGMFLAAAFLIWNIWRLTPWADTAGAAPGFYGEFALILATVFLAVNIVWLILALTRPVRSWFKGNPRAAR